MNSKIYNDAYVNNIIATTGIFAKLVIDDIVVNDITIQSIDVLGNVTFGKNIILTPTLGPQGITGEGQIIQGGITLLHTFGTNNTFLASSTKNSGNLTLTGTSNVGVGGLSLTALTTGNNNVALGFQSGLATTTGSNNVYLGFSTAFVNATGSNNIYISHVGGENGESDTIRIGTVAVIEAAYIAGTTFVTFQEFGGDVIGGGTITGTMIANGIVTASGTPIIFDTGTNIEAAIPSIAGFISGQNIKLLISNISGATVEIQGNPGNGVNLVSANFEIAKDSSRLVYINRTGIKQFTVY